LSGAFRSTEASPADRGEAFGAAHADRVAANHEAYLRLFGVSGINDRDAVEQLALELFETTRAYDPTLAAEIEGIARGAGLPLWAVAALNGRTEILARGTTAARGECSTVVFLPPTGAPPVAVQTWDWHEELEDGWFVWTIEHSDGHVSHTLTEYGIVGKIGVGSAGVGVHMNILRHKRDGRGGGVPVHVLARSVIDERGGLGPALARVAAAPVAASSAFTIVAAAAAESTALTVELHPGGPSYALPDDTGLLVHTNHFLAATAAEGDRERQLGPDSFVRYELLRRRLAGTHLDAESASAALESHICGGGAICCHPEPHAEAGGRYSTLATVALRVDEGTLRVRAGHPCGRGDWLDVAASERVAA
jgi:isopenicillin-N N-acyltransferase like protein